MIRGKVDQFKNKAMKNLLLEKQKLTEGVIHDIFTSGLVEIVFAAPTLLSLKCALIVRLLTYVKRNKDNHKATYVTQEHKYA